MPYLVARGTEPVVIKEMPSLEAALEYAGQLVSENYSNVGIHDGKGNQISGGRPARVLSRRDEIDARPASR